MCSLGELSFFVFIPLVTKLVGGGGGGGISRKHHVHLSACPFVLTSVVCVPGFLTISRHERQGLSALGRDQSSTEPDAVRTAHGQYKTRRPQRLGWSKGQWGSWPLPARGDQVWSPGFLVPGPGRCSQRTVHLSGPRVSGCSACTQVSGLMPFVFPVFSIFMFCACITVCIFFFFLLPHHFEMIMNSCNIHHSVLCFVVCVCVCARACPGVSECVCVHIYVITYKYFAL